MTKKIGLPAVCATILAWTGPAWGAPASFARPAFDQGIDTALIVALLKAGRLPEVACVPSVKAHAVPSDAPIPGSVNACRYYLDEAERTTCRYPGLAYPICRKGNPLCGKPDSEANACTRQCLVDRYKLDQRTVGCFEKKKDGSRCPILECLYYDHSFCFAQCACEKPAVPL